MTSRAYRPHTNPVNADDLPEAEDLYDDFHERAALAQMRERHAESAHLAEDELAWL
ncbi:hypothetical protein ACPWT1_20360 [Ramlibacter sp. MMS24-I3-19]|uniref:hypothetical protein n=1 Tax=Ramlibacter sp. MMS24-I3-19 TaxID=3416606 RepID=UPI003D035035